MRVHFALEFGSGLQFPGSLVGPSWIVTLTRLRGRQAQDVVSGCDSMSLSVEPVNLGLNVRKLLMFLSRPVLYRPLLDIPPPTACLLRRWKPTTHFLILKDQRALCKLAKVGHSKCPQDLVSTALTRDRHLWTPERLAAIDTASTSFGSPYSKSKSPSHEHPTTHKWHKAIFGDTEPSAAHAPIL